MVCDMASRPRGARPGPLLLLAVLALTLHGAVCSALECPANGGKIWDGCNWCFCKDGVVVGCTNMACVDLADDEYRVNADQPTIGPPDRPGMFAYRPGRGRVVDPSGWPCQIGSTWLEAGGCVRCSCSNKRIKCRDSGLCPAGKVGLGDESEGSPSAAQLIRRRRDADSAAPPAEAAPAAAVVSPTDTPAAAAAGQLAVEAEVPTTTATPSAAPPAAPVEAANTTEGPFLATTAQATVVKDRSCKSGSTWEEECNSCWCLDNGRAACTTATCEASLAALPLGAAPARKLAGPASAPASAPPSAPASALASAPAPAPAPAPASAPAPAPASAPDSTQEAAPKPATDTAPVSATTSSASAASATTAAPKATSVAKEVIAEVQTEASPGAAPVTGNRRKKRFVLVAT